MQGGGSLFDCPLRPEDLDLEVILMIDQIDKNSNDHVGNIDPSLLTIVDWWSSEMCLALACGLSKSPQQDPF